MNRFRVYRNIIQKDAGFVRFMIGGQDFPIYFPYIDPYRSFSFSCLACAGWAGPLREEEEDRSEEVYEKGLHCLKQAWACVRPLGSSLKEPTGKSR